MVWVQQKMNSSDFVKPFFLVFWGLMRLTDDAVWADGAGDGFEGRVGGVAGLSE